MKDRQGDRQRRAELPAAVDRPLPPIAMGAGTAEERALWARLCAYRFGDDQVEEHAFLARVAKDAGVRIEVARDAVGEYRRFVFLACVADEEMTPSRLVDAVWHAHLTDSRAYWEVFCPTVLQRPLHHQPGRGETGDQARFRMQYEATLDAYRRWFGEQPATIWPAPGAPAEQVRSASDEETKRTLAGARAIQGGSAGSGGWRRPPWPVLASALLYAGLALGSGNALPWEWRGPAFLCLYAMLIVLCIWAGARIRRWLLRRPDTLHAALDEEQLAYLAGGAARVAELRFVRLLMHGAVELVEGGDGQRARFRLRGGAGLPPPLQPWYRSIASIQIVDEALATLRGQTWSLEDALADAGAWTSAGRNLAICLAGAAPLLALVLLGVVRLVVGMQRERPVEGLTMLMLVAGAAALVMMFRSVRVTRAGERALSQSSEHARTVRSTVSSGTADQGEVLRALAVVGSVGLLQTPWEMFHQLRAPVTAKAGDGSSIAGCASDHRPIYGDHGGSADSGGGDSGSDGGSSCGSSCGGCGGGGD